MWKSQKGCSAMKKLYVLFFVLLLMPVMPAHAQDAEGVTEETAEQSGAEEQSREEQQDAIMERLRNNNPYLEKLRKASIEFIKDIPEDAVKPLFMIRESYGIIHSIHSVKRDIGNAVDQCAEANPDMAEDMNGRFEAWSDEVTPALEEQDEKLKAVIQKQAYKDPQEINEYLGLIDEAAAYADEMLDKQVVTSEEACTSLMNSMDSTEENIVELLVKTPIPELTEDGTAPAEDTPEETGIDSESE